MRRSILKAVVMCAGLATVVAATGSPSAAGPQAPSPATPTQQVSPSSASTSPERALVNRYCVSCHNERLKTAGLMLDNVNIDDLGSGAAVWEKVVRKLRAGRMPPKGRPRPGKGTNDAFVAWLETGLDRAAAAAPNPGRLVPHRLNRVEYTNAIRDLLHLEIDGTSLLPADDAGFGFDNIGDVLTITPALLERYLIAAQRISRLAMGDPTIPPAIEQYQTPYLTLRQGERMSEELPFGSRGGTVVRHTFPVDGEYIIRVRLERHALSIGHLVRGLDITNEIDVRIDGERVHMFTLGGDLPEDAAVYDNSPGGRRDFLKHADDTLDVRLPVKAGPRTIQVSFRKTNWEVEGIGPTTLPVVSWGFTAATETGRDGRIHMGVDNIQIVGPYNGTRPEDTPTRRRIFVCDPTSVDDEAPCAQTILSTLARRAYRRPVTEEDLRILLDFYEDGRRRGDFETGIQAALKRLLTDPEFLVRVEHDPVDATPGTAYRITDLDLASRLSFFLWSSIPDDELLDLAIRGELSDPSVLQQQVQRLLADDRAEALLGNFFGQWLWVRNMENVAPDPKVFPDFDDNLREAFQRETELFLQSQFDEDRSITDILTADYTFLNERLAEHYGIPGVNGAHFRRVSLTDGRRAGLLGHGSILTVTSYANRTSPVVRGKWVLENLLGTPPPPPPPIVPPFPEGEGASFTSVRERMEQHRTNPVCAACHNDLDPLGFAFENFDAVGKWRDLDGTTPVDPSGAFPSGTPFAGPSEFRNALLEHSHLFVPNLIERLMTYALGRGVEYYDMPAVRKITRDIASDDHRWSSLILSIVKSDPFQMRRSES